MFVLKSVVAFCTLIGRPVIAQFYDIKKFFDRESLRDGMDALYNAKVAMKLYRLW